MIILTNNYLGWFIIIGIVTFIVIVFTVLQLLLNGYFHKKNKKNEKR